MKRSVCPSHGRLGAIALSVALLTGCQALSPNGLGPSGVGTAPATDPAATVPGEVLVKFRPQVPASDRAALREHWALGGHAPVLADTEQWKLKSDANAALRVLSASPLLEYAQPNYRRTVQALLTPERSAQATYAYFKNIAMVPGNPTVAPVNQWYLGKERGLDVDAAWDLWLDRHPGTLPGQGALVAICDTGIDFNHPDLESRIATTSQGVKRFYDEVGADAYLPSTGQNFTGADGNGHGTHVAGLIAAAANGVGLVGVAPGASLLPVKVMRADGGGDDATIARGLKDAADAGADVINLSVGGSLPSQTLANALAYCMAKGSTVVIAAGNGYGPVYYPAAYQGVVCVGATSGAVGSPWSIPAYSNRGEQLSLVAPGGDDGGDGADHRMLSCWPTYAFYGSQRYAKPLYYGPEVGTSMATPIVSGVAAMLVADARMAGYSLGPAQVRERLIASATPLSAAPFDPNSGYGLVNPRRALQWTHSGGNGP